MEGFESVKLKKLIINNFKGLRGEANIIDFEKSDIIFLIGKNNTGKSTILQAYNFFVTSKQKATLSHFTDQDLQIPIEITAEFIVEEDDQGDMALKKNEPDWIKNWVDPINGTIIIRKTWTELDKDGAKQTYNPKEAAFVDGGFGGFDTLLTKYAPNAILINAISTPEELEKAINDIILTNHLKKLETNHSDQYHALVKGIEELRQAISDSDDIHEINSKMNGVFKSVFPDLELNIYPIPDSGLDITKTIKSSHGIKVTDTKDEKLFNDLKNNGHGVIRQAFFSFLSTFEASLENRHKEYLILFEEPELFLHPEAIFSLRKQLYELANDSPFQVLCATHSSSMIDTSMPHSSLVRLVKDEKRLTKTYQVQFDAFDGEDKNYLQMINRFNPHICESFYSDEVLLVEGDTEAIVYRDLIERYFSNQRDIFVLNTGSKANIPFYQRILTHFSITHTVIHDIDSPNSVDRSGKTKVNGMWTINESIWTEIQRSNKPIPGLSRRFVHYRNFEEAHNYSPNSSKGKPLSAFEFARSLTLETELPCIEFLTDLFDERKINHSQDYLLDVYKKGNDLLSAATTLTDE